jgi:hypothetical protein
VCVCVCVYTVYPTPDLAQQVLREQLAPLAQQVTLEQLDGLVKKAQLVLLAVILELAPLEQLDGLVKNTVAQLSAVEDDGEVQDNRSGSGHWENECDHLSDLDENQVEGTEDDEGENDGEVKDDLDWEKMHSFVREKKIDELENWKAHLAKTDENEENLFHSAAYGRRSVFTSLYSRVSFYRRK